MGWTSDGLGENVRVGEHLRDSNSKIVTVHARTCIYIYSITLLYAVLYGNMKYRFLYILLSLNALGVHLCAGC